MTEKRKETAVRSEVDILYKVIKNDVIKDMAVNNLEFESFKNKINKIVKKTLKQQTKGD